MSGTRTGNRKRPLADQPVAQALVFSTAITALGNGLFAAMSFLYFTRIQGLPPTTAGVSLTVVGLVAVAVAVPFGRILERRDTAIVNAVLLVAQAVGVAGIAVARPTVPLIVFIGAITIVSQIKLAARGAILVRGVAHAERIRVRAWVRTVSNLGMAVGSGLAAVLLAVDTRISYLIAFGLVGLCYVLGAWPLWKLRGTIASPSTSPWPSRAGSEISTSPSRSVLRNRRYVAVALLSGILGVHYLILQVGLPLWVSADALRPLWLVAAGLIVNTAVVAVGQLPLSRMVSDVRSACVAVAVAGACFMVACSMIALAGLTTGGGEVALVLGAVLIYSVGEIFHATGSWELSFELAPSDRPTEYQSVFSGGLSLGTAIAPALITGLLSGFGDAGWVLLGGGLLIVGLAHLFVSQGSSVGRELA